MTLSLGPGVQADRLKCLLNW